MWLKTLDIERSALNRSSYVLTATTQVGEQVYQATLKFDNTMQDFALAVESLMVYFGQAHGIVKIDADGDVVAQVKRADRIIPQKVLKNFTVLPSKNS